jgi:hypothetical protein
MRPSAGQRWRSSPATRGWQLGYQKSCQPLRPGLGPTAGQGLYLAMERRHQLAMMVTDRLTYLTDADRFARDFIPLVSHQPLVC